MNYKRVSIPQLQMVDLLWPENCQLFHGCIVQDILTESSHWLKHVTNFDVCIQAGGHCGVYPLFYKRYFNKVYTFEVSRTAYVCLSYNTLHESNIYTYRAAIGSENKTIGISGETYNNSGGNKVVGTGDIPTFTIDQLGLQKCDLIHIDIEGAELQALKGAKSTIINYKPVIITEGTACEQYLKDLGYIQIYNGGLNGDTVYLHHEKI